MKRNSQIEVAPLSGALGAEISGVDLSEPLEDAVFEDIREALHEHLVICFREQHLTPESHKDFGRRFGPLNVHPHYRPVEGHPEILPILKQPGDTGNIGGVWHSDVSFLERPALGSLLYALEVPSHGGDTLFANQYLAYETLSEGMRGLLDELSAVHSDAVLSRPENKTRANAERSTKLKEEELTQEVENVHPVIRAHGDTGRRCLYVNSAFTQRFQEMTVAESRPLLEFLYEHAVRPEFTCRVAWEKDMLVMWDNRCTQHYALNDYPGQRRAMHRVTVEGERPR